MKRPKPHEFKSRGDGTPKKDAPKTATAKVSLPKRVIPSRPVQTSGRFAGKPYQRTQREYAELYGVQLITVKRWWKAGRPCDDPDLMGEFLSPRGRKNDVPGPVFEPPGVAPADDSGGEGSEDLPISLDETFFTGRGVLAAIERLQKAERERAAAYFGAIRSKAVAQVLKNRFQEWIGIVEALRKLEKDAPEIRKLNALTIDRAELEAALGQIFQSFRAAANNLPGRATSKLVGLRDHDEILDLLEREVEVLLRTLTEIALDAMKQAEANSARGNEQGDA